MTISYQHNPHITLISDPKVTAIPIKEIMEPMIDIQTKTDLLFGPSPEIPNNKTYTFMRYTVYKKLLEAQSRIPSKYRFCLYEGHRTLELQKELFEKHFNHLKKIYTSWSNEEVFKEATKLFSPVKNLDGTDNIPPHSTGAAVDIYLVDASGKALDMGIHPKEWMQDVDGSLSLTDSNKISSQAMKNRQMMSHALNSVGFINYPTEYWHWSYGDKYWAYMKQKNYAIYGQTSPSTQSINPKKIIDTEPSF